MRYVVAVSKAEEQNDLTILNCYELCANAEEAARLFVTDNPGYTALVYNWYAGYESERKVYVNRTYGPPEMKTPSLPDVQEFLAEAGPEIPGDAQP